VADLRDGKAAELPWVSDTLHLVIASTLFTSILNAHTRRWFSDEISRVLKPGGALLWYDFAVNNSANSNVQRASRRELEQLFPRLRGGQIRHPSPAFSPWMWLESGQYVTG
jgi:hypothetical protein